MSRLGDFLDVKLAAFWDRLNVADFHYQMSDDHGVFTRGDAEMHELRDIANSSPEHEELFRAFWAYKNGGTSLRPARPQVAA